MFPFKKQKHILLLNHFNKIKSPLWGQGNGQKRIRFSRSQICDLREWTWKISKISA